MLRIWDTFLYEGSKVLFRFAIAIFKYNEEAILATENSIGIFNKLRTMCQDATEVNRLVQVRQWRCLCSLDSLCCCAVFSTGGGGNPLFKCPLQALLSLP